MRDGEASTTARRVAAHRVSFRRVPTTWGRPDDDQRLQVDVAGGLQLPATTMGRYLQARTAFFDDVVIDAIEGGIDQIVVVGAGYDGRSLRYAKDGVRWFELDHPDTQRDKVARLDRLGIDHAGIGFATADFAVDDVGAALGLVGHDPCRPTLFTCEGVAAYLSTEVLRSLLSSLALAAAPGTGLALTLALEATSVAGRSSRARLGTAVAGMGEPLVSAVARDSLGPFLTTAGWATVRATDPTGLDLTQSDRSSAFVFARVN